MPWGEDRVRLALPHLNPTARPAGKGNGVHHGKAGRASFSNDTIKGYRSSEPKLSGGLRADDNMDGGAGNDRLNGGRGSDILKGKGNGKRRHRFQSRLPARAVSAPKHHRCQRPEWAEINSTARMVYANQVGLSAKRPCSQVAQGADVFQIENAYFRRKRAIIEKTYRSQFGA